MIKFFFTKKDYIEIINIKGHSFYENKGKDIVCASVSTSIIVTLNAIEILDLKKNVFFKLKEGNFYLKVLKFDFIVDKLLLNLEYSLMELSKNYPKNLKKTQIKNF
ncbi:ribosomal-processing cysteine protease Prp [Texas Phoenix palm phytoplasma]|uniref:Ribosomal processing cysteine protease Prp n=1 Tax=Texas Phoenix palm phytoplasma TaxID=176709 RepID=A0ABS5BJV0_9MOLU|nr:ribosomal-processing cysteine protease Prp [Texas Phoenix palm phytoplasma]MBP3059464.1 ribosomal-processing cysteine protease Prp [Texas Phoenix palm phytoplasma]